jgi:hypothetical protein
MEVHWGQLQTRFAQKLLHQGMLILGSSEAYQMSVTSVCCLVCGCGCSGCWGALMLPWRLLGGPNAALEAALVMQH